MRRRLFLFLLLVALTAGLPGASAASKVVETQDFKFVPLEISVNVGDTIVFRNTGEAPHNAQADDGSFKIALINPGAEEKVVISKAGTISYVCTFHRAQGMTGKIVAQEAAGGALPAQSPAPAETAPEAEAEEEAQSDAEPQAAAKVPTEKYFPALGVGMLVLLMGALGLGYLRFILKAAQQKT